MQVLRFPGLVGPNTLTTGMANISQWDRELFEGTKKVCMSYV